MSTWQRTYCIYGDCPETVIKVMSPVEPAIIDNPSKLCGYHNNLLIRGNINKCPHCNNYKPVKNGDCGSCSTSVLDNLTNALDVTGATIILDPDGEHVKLGWLKGATKSRWR